MHIPFTSSSSSSLHHHHLLLLLTALRFSTAICQGHHPVTAVHSQPPLPLRETNTLFKRCSERHRTDTVDPFIHSSARSLTHTALTTQHSPIFSLTTRHTHPSVHSSMRNTHACINPSFHLSVMLAARTCCLCVPVPRQPRPEYILLHASRPKLIH